MSYKANNPNKVPVQFTLADAQRIAHAVGKVEGDRRPRKGSTLPRAVGGGGVQLATFTGGWTVGQSKVVNIGGDSNSTTSVRNIFHSNVGFVYAARDCLISGDILVAVRC